MEEEEAGGGGADAGGPEASGSTGAHSTIIIPIEINFKYPNNRTASWTAPGRPSFFFSFYCKTAMTHLEGEFWKNRCPRSPLRRERQLDSAITPNEHPGSETRGR